MVFRVGRTVEDVHAEVLNQGGEDALDDYHPHSGEQVLDGRERSGRAAPLWCVQVPEERRRVRWMVEVWQGTTALIISACVCSHSHADPRRRYVQVLREQVLGPVGVQLQERHRHFRVCHWRSVSWRMEG